MKNQESGIGKGGRAGETPALRRWVEKLAAGYTIRPRLRLGRSGYVEWGPGLFNPEGAFVQNVRRDTLRRLMRLGLFERVDELVMEADDGNGEDGDAGMDGADGRGAG